MFENRIEADDVVWLDTFLKGIAGTYVSNDVVKNVRIIYLIKCVKFFSQISLVDHNFIVVLFYEFNFLAKQKHKVLRTAMKCVLAKQRTEKGNTASRSRDLGFQKQAFEKLLDVASAELRDIEYAF